jgi:hypothetical protein
MAIFSRTVWFNGLSVTWGGCAQSETKAKGCNTQTDVSDRRHAGDLACKGKAGAQGALCFASPRTRWKGSRALIGVWCQAISGQCGSPGPLRLKPPLHECHDVCLMLASAVCIPTLTQAVQPDTPQTCRIQKHAWAIRSQVAPLGNGVTSVAPVCSCHMPCNLKLLGESSQDRRPKKVY